jgi:BASS family bile acid:Na+ symporter
MQESILTSVLLPAALFVIMFGLGLSLTPADFKRMVVFPKAVLVGAFAQLVLLPALGFIIAYWLLRDSPALAVGLILLALCPGGTTANLITHLGRGDTALCITLTAISSCVKIFTIPLFVNLAIQYYMGGTTQLQLDLLRSITGIVIITVIPASLGMLVRSRSLGFAQKAERPVKIASAVFLVLVIIASLIKERNNLATFMAQCGPAALVLNLAGMSLGYFIPQLLHLPVAQRITISIETSIQNGTLAIGIATSPLMLGNSAMAIPAAVYSIIMFITVAIFLWQLNKRLGRGQHAAG